MSPVRLRPLRLGDWEAVHSWAQLPEACRYQSWGPNTPDQTRTFVTALVEAPVEAARSRMPYAVEIDGHVIGLGVLHVYPGRHGEISYTVHPDRWGQGIGTSVGQQLVRIGFREHKLHRIIGTCDPRNVGSGRILVKIGMSYEGRMRETAFIRDGWRDSDLYSILEHEFSGPSPE